MVLLHTLLSSRRVVVMGIINRTPDSFSDGGMCISDTDASRRADELIEQGAAIIDAGAESTRPGSESVPAEEQIRRLGNIISQVTKKGAIASIDTTSSDVAQFALDQGATIVNSVSLDSAAALGRVCASYGAKLVLMHSRGSMSAMRGYSLYDDKAYGDVVADVKREWLDAADCALSAGLTRDALIFDPGLGFAKSANHSVELCRRLSEFGTLSVPILVGPSRKSFIAKLAPRTHEPPPAERLGGTIAAVLACVQRGASMVRVHDVAEVVQALRVHEAICAPDHPPHLGAA